MCFRVGALAFAPLNGGIYGKVSAPSIGLVISLHCALVTKRKPGIDLLNFSDHLTYGLGVRLLDYQFDYAVEVPRGPEGKRLNVFELMLRF